MSTRLLSAALTMIVGTFLFTLTPAAHAAPGGLHVQEGRLYDASGRDVVARGVNHLHAQHPKQTSSFENIAGHGANAVRAMLSSGHLWEATKPKDVVETVLLCEQAELLCVLTIADTMGYGEQPGAASLSEAVDYWISVQSALPGSENNVIINIGRGPHAGSASESWTSDTIDAIQRLRDAGFSHTLMVDAPDRGQDWQGIMLNNAPQVAASDPAANTVFSVHMYDAFSQASHVEQYLSAFADNGLPIMISEFAPRDGEGADAEAVMSIAESLQLGYFGWRWSGNDASTGSAADDLVVAFDPTQLTEWGEEFFGGLAGPPVGSCTAVYEIVWVWSGGGFHADVTVTAGNTPIDGWRVTWTFTHGEEITNAWSAEITARGPNIAAVDAGWNGNLDPGESTTFGFLGTWDGITGTYQLDCSPRA